MISLPTKTTYNTPHIAKPSGQGGRQAQRQEAQTIGLFDVLLDPWKNPGKYRTSDDSSHSLDILA